MKKKHIKKVVYTLIIVALFSFLLFNEYGIIKYLKLRNEVSKLNQEISQTEKELKKLVSEIDSVKTNLYKIEQLARERYHMLDKNEQALKIETKEKN